MALKDGTALMNTVSTLYKWGKEILGVDDDDDDDKEARAKARAKEAGRKTFAYKRARQAYGRGMRAAKTIKHKPQPMEDHYRVITALLDKHKHRTKEKAKYFALNTVQNKSKMSRLNPRDQGMVISEFEKKFLIGDQEVQEEKAKGPTITV